MSKWIYLGGIKAFIDGSLGSNSALFDEVRIDSGIDKILNNRSIHGFVFLVHIYSFL